MWHLYNYHIFEFTFFFAIIVSEPTFVRIDSDSAIAAMLAITTTKNNIMTLSSGATCA